MTLNEVVDILYKEMLHTVNPKKKNALAVAIKAIRSWQKNVTDEVPGQLSFDDILKEEDDDDKK